jgi:trimeric autotransporter adhesin
MKRYILYSICMILVFSACVSAETILPGEYKTGSISVGGVYTYIFSANAGDTVTILMGEISDFGNFTPKIELIEPDGTNTSAYGVNAAVINAKKIKSSGSCVIVAHDSGWLAVGTYGLSLMKNPGTDVNDPEDSSVPILPGEYKTGKIDIGDLDGYTFYANAGDIVTICMGETVDYGGFDPQVELIEPDGTRTSVSGTTSTTFVAINAKKINTSGNCLIIAREKDGYQTGLYGLSMVKKPGTGEAIPDNNAITILPGEYKTGCIDKGSLDGYTFDANAGDVVTVLMGKVADYGGFAPQVEIIEPNGVRTYVTGTDSAAINAKKITQSGKYMIIARSNNGSYAGTYGLSMVKNPGTFVNDIEDSTVAILPGENKTGYINYGDLDGYSFHADAGDVVSIIMQKVIDFGGFDPQVELIEPDGTRTSASGTSSATISNKTISLSGNCLIIAREKEGNQTGSYNLSMQKIAPISQ